MNIIPVGGKTPSNTAAAVAVNANGKLDTVKTWSNDYVALTVNGSAWITPGTTAKYTENLDVSECAMISLLISNTAKDSSSNAVPVTFSLTRTDNESGTDLLRDMDGNYITFTVGATGYTMITPEDVPALKYLKNLRLRIKTDTAVSSGQVNIKAFLKK